MIRAHLFFSWRQSGAAILRFLVTESETGDLSIRQSQQGVILAFWNFNRGRKLSVSQRAVRVVAKFRRIIFSVRIVVDTFVRDARKWHARIILQRFPGPQPFFDLFRKHCGISSSFEGFLSHLPGDLVIAMAVRASSDKDGSDNEWTRHALNTYNIPEHSIMSPF